MRYPLAILACLNFQELLQNSIKTGVSLTYEYTDGDKRRVWKLTPHIELGYPGAFDKDVLITIQKLVTDAGFPPPNPFALPSLRQICKLMGIIPTGPNMKAIKTSLKRWAFTGIETNSFYLKDQDRYWEGDDSFNGAVFTIWSVYWKGKRLPNGSTAERTYLYFNPPFYLSLLAFYMQPLGLCLLYGATAVGQAHLRTPSPKILWPERQQVHPRRISGLLSPTPDCASTIFL
jgi:hypothetical protein